MDNSYDKSFSVIIIIIVGRISFSVSRDGSRNSETPPAQIQCRIYGIQYIPICSDDGTSSMRDTQGVATSMADVPLNSLLASILRQTCRRS